MHLLLVHQINQSSEWFLEQLAALRSVQQVLGEVRVVKAVSELLTH